MVLLFVLFCLTGLIDACVEHRGIFSIDHVVDGDTVAVWFPGLPAPLNHTTMGVRIRGIDSPEKEPRSRCPREAERAMAALAFTSSFLLGRRPQDVGILLCGWDKYGGRVLGDMLVWDGGASPLKLSDHLRAEGHAVDYSGHGPRRDWCLT